MLLYFLLDSVKDAEVQQERQQLEVVRGDLQRQISDLETQLKEECQKLRANYDERIEKREHELKLLLDEKNMELIGHELKVNIFVYVIFLINVLVLLNY